MPKGMVVKQKPPTRDKNNNRVLMQKVGEFTDAEFKRLVKEGVVVPIQEAENAAAPNAAPVTADDKGSAATTGDKTKAPDAVDSRGNSSGSGSRKAL